MPAGGCRGFCVAEFSNNYESIDGFAYAVCDKNRNTTRYIGFWCIDSDGSRDTGSVLKISKNCYHSGNDADQGIGITEEGGKFSNSYGLRFDFGNNALTNRNTSYSLNLWVK